MSTWSCETIQWDFICLLASKLSFDYPEWKENINLNISTKIISNKFILSSKNKWYYGDICALAIDKVELV